jgi:hypothetical protein
MQNSKWIIGLSSAFVLMTILSLILEGAYGTESSLLLRLMQPAFWPPGAAWDFIKAVWQMLWFNYSFFYGPFNIVRWAVFVPISVGLVVALGVEVFLRIRIPLIYN